MRRRLLALPTLVLGGVSLATSPVVVASPVTLVVCAPGYPGTTDAAQPTMDQFARIVADSASWPAGGLRAVYFETAEGGVKRLAEPDAAFALVSLPFFLQHEADLGLAPKLQAVQESGGMETWSLAARRGRVPSAMALDGWEITGGAGYAPEFVRGPVLGGWGSLPASTRITFAPAVLSGLRRAASGEPVAVLLDVSQAKALSSLPFAADLEIVARSAAMPGTLLCTVGGRLPPRRTDPIVRGLESLQRRPEGLEILKTMRLRRFETVDLPALNSARKSFAAARGAVPTAP
jgi:hypothetical protein